MEKVSAGKVIVFALVVAGALGLVTWGFAGLKSEIVETGLLLTGEQESVKGFGGVGLEITKTDGFITVVQTLDGRPADKVGVEAGDRIVKINDEPVGDDPNITDIVAKLRGEQGTEVTITVARGDETKTFTITREKIEAPAPRVRIIERRWPRITKPAPGQKECPACEAIAKGSARYCPMCGHPFEEGRKWEPKEFRPFAKEWPWARRGDKEAQEEYREVLRKLREAQMKLWRSFPHARPFRERDFPEVHRFWQWDFPEERLLDFSMPKLPRKAEEFRMDMDVEETDDAITIRCDVPGMKKEDIDITLKGNLLTIRGKREVEEETRDEKGRVVRRERRSGSFSRSFTVPDEAKTEEIKTSYEDGVLTVVIPKGKPKEEKEKEIKIKIGTI